MSIEIILAVAIPVLGQTLAGIFWLARLHSDVKNLIDAVKEIRAELKPLGVISQQVADLEERVAHLEARVTKLEFAAP